MINSYGKNKLRRILNILDESILLLEASPVKELQKAIATNSAKVVPPSDMAAFEEAVKIYNTGSLDKK